MAPNTTASSRSRRRHARTDTPSVATVAASNVMVIDAQGSATRVGYRRDEETGRNVRVSRRSGKDI